MTSVATTSGPIKAFAVRSAGQAWAFGNSGVFALDGGTWSHTYSPAFGPSVALAHATGIWAGSGAGELIHSPDGVSWETNSFAPGNKVVFAPSPTEAYAFSDQGWVIHWNPDAGWAPSGRLMYLDGGVGGGIGAWGASASDIWVAGGTTLFRGSGTQWTEYPVAGLQYARNIHGSGPNDIWAMGGVGQCAHWDGGTWAIVPGGFSNVPQNAVWAFSPTDAWSAGGGIFHWDGGSWALSATLPTVGELKGIYGLSPNDIWAVGGSPTNQAPSMLMHWDGGTWTYTSGPQTAEFYAIHGRDGDVWAVGYGVVAHLDGGGWSYSAPLGPGEYLTTVQVLAPGDVLAGTWADEALFRHLP